MRLLLALIPSLSQGYVRPPGEYAARSDRRLLPISPLLRLIGNDVSLDSSTKRTRSIGVRRTSAGNKEETLAGPNGVVPALDRDFAIKATILTALVVQSAGVSLLAQAMCRTVSYSGAAVSLVQEIAKLPVAIAFLCLTGQASKLGSVLRRAYLRPVEMAQLCLPAGCFAAQNVLFFVAHERISSTTYLVLSQTKALFTALFTVLLLPGKRLGKRKWIAQPILAAGAALVLAPQISSQPHHLPSSLSRFFVGVNAALGSAVISGFANVYFERLIKRDDDAFWPRQLQLATATALFTLFALPRNVPLTDLIGQFTGGVWAIVALKSLGGLLIGATIKYTSAISKNFCTATAIAITALLSPTCASSPAFSLGLVCVFASMALFNWPSANRHKPNRGRS